MKFGRNLEYQIEISERAEYHLEQILIYILFKFRNPDAVKSMKRDMETTKKKLTYLAECIKLCEEPELAMQGYRVILFQKHDYLMLYRVEGNIVYVDGIYHHSQNYQSLFK